MKGYSKDENMGPEKKAGSGRYAGGLGLVHSASEIILMFLASYTGLGLVLGW